jgi:hypothetical protein
MDRECQRQEWQFHYLKKEMMGRERERERETHVIGEEDAVVPVLGLRVHPRVGDEGEGAAAGDVVEGDGLEEELGAVVVLDDDGSRDAQLPHLPVEGDAELGLAGGQRRQARQPLLQVRLRAHAAAVAVVCTQHMRWIGKFRSCRDVSGARNMEGGGVSGVSRMHAWG